MHGRTPRWTLAERLKKAREDADMTPEHMAAQLHCSAATVRNYEGGRTTPNHAVIQLWSSITGVDDEWITDGLSSDQRAEVDRLIAEVGEAAPVPTFLLAQADRLGPRSRCGSPGAQPMLPGFESGSVWAGTVPLFSRSEINLREGVDVHHVGALALAS